VRKLLLATLALLAAGCSDGEPDRFTVRFKAVPPVGHRVTVQDLERSAAVVRERLRRLRLGEATVRVAPPRHIRVTVPKKTPRTAIIFATRRGTLELYDFETHLASPSRLGRGQPLAISDRRLLLSRIEKGNVVIRCKVKTGATAPAFAPRPAAWRITSFAAGRS
jgi:hypothetical protein